MYCTQLITTKKVVRELFLADRDNGSAYPTGCVCVCIMLAYCD